MPKGKTYQADPSVQPITELVIAFNVRRLNAEGRKGLISLLLQGTSGGLYVEREEIPRQGLRTAQSFHFTAIDDFERWCSNDSLRFEHPLLHIRVKRAGGDLWGVEPRSSA